MFLVGKTSVQGNYAKFVELERSEVPEDLLSTISKAAQALGFKLSPDQAFKALAFGIRNTLQNQYSRMQEESIPVMRSRLRTECKRLKDEGKDVAAFAQALALAEDDDVPALAAEYLTQEDSGEFRKRFKG